MTIEPSAEIKLKVPAFVLLWLALIAQFAWILVRCFRRIFPWARCGYPLTFVLACLLLALTNGRVRWVEAVLRVLISLAFLQAVGDRLGLFGGPVLRAFPGATSLLPRGVIPAVAVVATILESAFGLAMLLGISIPNAAIGSAALLFLFATAMTISGLSQFAYSVYLMSAGALFLAAIDLVPSA